MPKRIVGLTHYYTALKEFYAVETAVDDEELNAIIAYLQHMRNELPALPIVDDVLGESDGSALLERLFGFRRIVSLTPIETDSVIDFHENWSLAVTLRVDELEHRLAVNRNQILTAILDEMLKDAEGAVARYPTQHYASMLSHLRILRSGGEALPEWELTTLLDRPVVGAVLV